MFTFVAEGMASESREEGVPGGASGVAQSIPRHSLFIVIKYT